MVLRAFPGAIPDPGGRSGCAIAGWLSFCEFLPRCEYRGAVEASIYVNEGFRRRGIGRRLLQQASARGPQLGMHSLVGLIFSHNEASIALFRAAGFKRRSFLPASRGLIKRSRVTIFGRRPSANRTER
jgi:L-amino acid N-acyltransferase YncA